MGLIDDCNELPSMENWLNVGDWGEHHEIVEPTTSAPFMYHTEPSSTPSELSMFGKEGITQPFLKLDALEICMEIPDALVVESSGEEISNVSAGQENSVTMSAIGLPAVSLLDRTPSTGMVEASLYMEAADSPRGPLSPAALQHGKSSITMSHKHSHCDDASEAAQWMPVSRKSPKQQQPSDLPTGVGNPPFLAMATATTAGATIPTAAAPFLPIPVPVPGPAPAILFPTPLTLPTVPSMEEIAQSRPKRRNVRISKDPTSVAARHRRERISDRVRVLQHFVPGGTKMDTASMLDEAIHYVKFLQQQLQILERLGNSYPDRLFMMPDDPLMMHQVSNSPRPFDLNHLACCSTYPSSTPMAMQQASQEPLPLWANTKRASAICSQGFPEQFCH